MQTQENQQEDEAIPYQEEGEGILLFCLFLLAITIPFPLISLLRFLFPPPRVYHFACISIPLLSSIQSTYPIILFPRFFLFFLLLFLFLFRSCFRVFSSFPW